MADEVELCEIRLAENYNLVDQYCIVESCYDQCGNPKPYNFELNIDRYKSFLNKVTYYKVEDKVNLRYSFDWSNEIYVRNCLSNALHQFYKEKNIRPKDTDKILFGDCDEIVNNKSLKQAIDLNKNLVSFTHLFNSYKLNYHAPARKWFGCILIDIPTFFEHGSFQKLREVKDHIEHFEDKDNPSWHFSGVGEDSFETNWNKWLTRIEPREKIPIELKEDYKKLFNKCVFEDKYFFYSDQIYRRDEDLKLEELSLDLLPECVKSNPEKYSKYLYVPKTQ